MVSFTKLISKTRGLSWSKSALYFAQNQVGNLCRKKAYERGKLCQRNLKCLLHYPSYWPSLADLILSNASRWKKKVKLIESQKTDEDI